MDLSPKQKKRLLRMAEVGQKGNLAIFEMILELEDRFEEQLPNIQNLIKIVKGEKGDSYVLTEQDKKTIAALIYASFDKKKLIADVAEKVEVPVKAIAEEASKLVKVENGKDGKTPTRAELMDIMRTLIPKLENGKDGAPGKDADEAAILENLTNNIAAYGERIRDSLELLQGDERLDKSAIKGLEEALKALSDKIDSSRRGNAGGGPRLVLYADLSPQCDGIIKTYQTPTFSRLVGLRGTQFPIIYRPGIDFTLKNKSITLSDEVAAVEAGQTLILEYIK